MPSSFIRFMSALTTSDASSLIGKILPPRSIFVATPSDSKKLIVSIDVNAVNALVRNLPLPGMLLMSSGTSAIFVMLQRPLPVIDNFFPTRLIFSSSTTCAPASAARIAAIKPAAPPPATTNFNCSTPLRLKRKITAEIKLLGNLAVGNLVRIALEQNLAFVQNVSAIDDVQRLAHVVIGD